jgi:NAD-dependent SIR2 family protein deacetylase
MLTEHMKVNQTIFLVGSGISVAAKIPCFRGKNAGIAAIRKGLSATSRMTELGQKDILRTCAQMFSMTEKARPTAFHMLVADVENYGYLQRMVTQNIDGIEDQLQLESSKCVFLHGKVKDLYCRSAKHHKFQIDQHQLNCIQNGVYPNCSTCYTETLKMQQNPD